MSDAAHKPPQERMVRRLAGAQISAEEPLLVGFSGGPDSVALTLWLMASGYTRLTLVHLDHALREESARESAWVRSFAHARGLEVRCARVDVARLAQETRVGIEEAGRNARHQLFAEIAQEQNIPRVALGHHADDQIETFLFRLLRGSGSGGLGGMPFQSGRKYAGFSYVLVRPMLDVWREEIRDFLCRESIAFLEDASNADPRWARNRIRHALMPALEAAAARPVRATLLRTMEHLRREDACLEEMAALHGTGESLVVAELRRLHAALQRRVVWNWLQRHRVPDCGQTEVERVLGLVAAIRPAKVNLPGATHACRRRGRIHLERPAL